MKIIVNAHKCEIDKTPVNEKEINITKCEFEFTEEITDEFVKEAYFTLGKGETYKQIIVDNECDIPGEVLEKKGDVTIGVVAYLVENNTTIKRYNPSPAYFNTWEGSLRNAENSQPITPSEMEQYEQALQDGLSEVNQKLVDIDEAIEDVNEAITEANNLDLDVSKTGKTATVTLTKKDATTKVVTLFDGTSLMFNWNGTKLGIKTDKDAEYTYVDLQGIKGETGLTPNIQIGTVTSGQTPNVTRTGTNENPILNFTLVKGDTGATGPTGETGATGNGIASITKTETVGLVDTYTITYTNGTTSTFEVTNGEDGDVTPSEFNALKADVEDLRDNQIILPEQGTNIHIEDAAKARLYEFELEKESTQDGEPSPSNPVEVKTVKSYSNLLNINGTALTKNARYSINEDTVIATSTLSTTNGGTMFTIPVQVGKTVTISYENVIFSTGEVNLRYKEYDEAPESIESISQGTSISLEDKYKTITTTKPYLTVLIRTANGATTTVFGLMVAYTDEKVAYVPYDNNTYISIKNTNETDINYYAIPLNNNEIVGIGDYKDELLVDKNGNVFINKKTGKVVLDGSESGYGATNTQPTNTDYHSFYYNGLIYKKRFNGNILMTHFKKLGTTSIISSSNSEGFWYNSSSSALQIGFISVQSNVDDFKTWLSTHNTEVYYALETPETIDLQTTVDLKLFKGVNNISNSEDGNMSIRYVESVDDILENKQDTLVSGTNIKTINNYSLLGEGNINISGGGSGTDDYDELNNKPQINSTTLTGNKSLADLGIQGEITSTNKIDAGFVDDSLSTNKFVTSTEKITWNNKSDFSGNYNDLTNKPTIPTVPTNVSAFTNDAGYLTQHQDITGKLDTSKVKTTTSTTSGDVYDVTYINTMLGDIESLLGGI